LKPIPIFSSFTDIWPVSYIFLTTDIYSKIWLPIYLPIFQRSILVQVGGNCLHEFSAF